MSDSTNITELLERDRRGDKAAREMLAQKTYPLLRRMARAMGATPDDTLQPTALVNETWKKQNGRTWANDAHFTGSMRTTMKRLWISDHRRKGSQKRRGIKVPLDTGEIGIPETTGDEIAFKEALKSLEHLHPRLSEILYLLVVEGLTKAEIAQRTGISLAQLGRITKRAKDFLSGDLSEPKQA